MGIAEVSANMDIMDIFRQRELTKNIKRINTTALPTKESSKEEEPYVPDPNRHWAWHLVEEATRQCKFGEAVRLINQYKLDR